MKTSGSGGSAIKMVGDLRAGERFTYEKQSYTVKNAPVKQDQGWLVSAERDDVAVELRFPDGASVGVAL